MKSRKLFNDTDRNELYHELESVLKEAYDQASIGKGKERHANDNAFEDQLICLFERLHLSFCEGQAIKKIIEAHRTRSNVDRLGAINYIAALIITSRELDSIERYVHHNKLVAVRRRFKGQHREHCLCYSCKRFKTDDDEKCPIASAVFKNCVDFDLVTPVWECPEYEEEQ